MNFSYWKKSNKQEELIGILIKENSVYTCHVEIKEDYSNEFILNQITHEEFTEICRIHNCLTLPEYEIIPLSSSLPQ